MGDSDRFGDWEGSSIGSICSRCDATSSSSSSSSSAGLNDSIVTGLRTASDVLLIDVSMDVVITGTGTDAGVGEEGRDICLR